MKYVTIREHLRELATAQLKPGDKLPSERELVEQFAVSRMTIRQAIDDLEAEGVVERSQGRGTFVAQPKMDLQVRLTSFDEEMRRRGMQPTSLVLDASMVRPPADVAASLEVETNSEVCYLKRVRLADGVPIAVSENWTLPELADELLETEHPPSIYTTLIARGLPPSWAEDLMEAVPIEDKDARLLNVPSGSAGMLITRRTYSQSYPVDVSRALYRGDRYAVWAPVSPPMPALVPPRRRHLSETAAPLQRRRP